ncbi:MULTISPECIES: thermonuclease family protein [Chelatococcus]|uniref:Endonuclease YncB(Thermonuclease family) n=1 Tax=Chelatococcus caeni TaxID=1348468 RepID=A0A840BV04_9HYPH|nr:MULTISPECIES: thermonuclease family protein [Chelatococcus]MBB4015512.1 endonuclease YncB(thermonuclease family) [Chelatococcus caeni]
MRRGRLATGRGGQRHVERRLRDLARASAILTGLLVALGLLLWREETRVAGSVDVVDGDTLRLADGRPLRLEGIDAPEIDQLCDKPSGPYPCGRAARSALVRLVAGADVTCILDGKDRYGRLLGRCSVGEEDVNASLVATGWAVASGRYHAEEAAAREGRLGLWQGRFERPADWRARR